MPVNRLSCVLIAAAGLASCGGSSGFGDSASGFQKTLVEQAAHSTTDVASGSKAAETSGTLDTGTVRRPLVRIAGRTLAPSGVYQLFATNGARYALQLNFETSKYSLNDASGAYVAGGSFSEDAGDEQGYIFAPNPPLASGAQARFRVSEDAVVGMYPLAAPFDANARELRPFIAVRRIATTLTQVAGNFNRISATRTALGAVASSLQVVSIRDGGHMDVCTARYTISQCPEGLRKHYVLQSAQPSPGQWVAVDQSNTNLREQFYVARVNGEPVFLRAETDLANGTSLFQVGLSETMFWRSATLRGGSTNAEDATTSIDATSFKADLLAAGGGTTPQQLTLSSSSTQTGPVGIRDASGQAGANSYLLLKSSRLSVLSGTTFTTAGYWQFGLVDVPRSMASPLPLKLTVKSNGTVVTPDGSGNYPIPSGTLLELEASRNIGMFDPDGDTLGWTMFPYASLNTGMAEATTRSLAMEVSNLSTNPLTIQVFAASVGGGVTSVKLVMSAGDARNGNYRRYSLTGSAEALRLDFDLRRYQLTDGSGSITGRFTEDPNEPGTYLFHSSRNMTAFNTARFRISSGIVVGAFPSRFATTSSVSYPVRPFVAVGTFLTSSAAAQFDGTYNVFRSFDTDGIRNSRVYQMRISQAGTVFEVCNDLAVQSIDACVSRRTYAIRAPSGSDGFYYYDPSIPGHVGTPFRMASINGRTIFLSATNDPFPLNHYLDVGLLDSPEWAQTFGRGGSTAGDYGLSQIGAQAYSASFVRPDGSTQSFNHALTAVTGITGIRGVNMAGTDRYFAAQGGSLALLGGEPDNPETRGYLRLELLD